MLTMHSVSFMLFIIVDTVQMVAYIFYLATIDKPDHPFLFWTATVAPILSFSSQILICVIFWQLTTVDKLNESSRIIVADFDLDAEL
jgi:uncharacterized membrane protein